MANTTLENVLTIAPELKNKVIDIAKKDSVEVANLFYDTEYTINIDGVDYTYTSSPQPGTPDEEVLRTEIINGLASVLAGCAAIVVSNSSTKIITTAAVPGVSYSINVDINLIDNNLVHNHSGIILFNLLLEDVILQVTELNFKDEQERAQRYLLAHLLTITNIDPDNTDDIIGLVQEVVGDVQYKYGTDFSKLDEAFYGLSRYGIVFYEIMMRLWFRFI